MIRAEQIYTLRHDMLKRFVSQMCDHLLSRYPEQVQALSCQEFREKVQQGMRDAETYRITDQGDVRRYLEYLIEYGDIFYRGFPTTHKVDQFI